MVYAAGLLGYSVYFYLVRAFYSRQNTKTPAVLNVVIFLLYAALAYGLSQVWGIIGVVLGLAVAYSVLAILSLAAMRRETGRLDGRRLLGSFLKILLAGAAMYAVGHGSERRSSGWARTSRNAYSSSSSLAASRSPSTSGWRSCWGRRS